MGLKQDATLAGNPVQIIGIAAVQGFVLMVM